MNKLLFWLKLSLIVVPCAYTLNFIYALSNGGSGGTFGDTFGAANALFSGVALMMLIYAVILQREELNLVKEERNDTRALLEGQEEITRSQKAALDTQVYESALSTYLTILQSEKDKLNERLLEDSSLTRLNAALKNQEATIKRLSQLESLRSLKADPSVLEKLATPLGSNLTAKSTDTLISIYQSCIEFISSAEIKEARRASSLGLIESMMPQEWTLSAVHLYIRSPLFRKNVSDVTFHEMCKTLPPSLASVLKADRDRGATC